MEIENQRVVLYDDIMIEMIVYIVVLYDNIMIVIIIMIVYTPSHFFPFQTLGYLLTSTTSACSRIILADNSPTLVESSDQKSGDWDNHSHWG